MEEKSKKTIGLIVEDDLRIQGMLEMLIAPFVDQVLKANDGSEAVPLIEKFREQIKIIVTDCDMLPMDGLTMLKTTFKEPLPNGEIIMATGKMDPERNKELLKLYRSGVLTGLTIKPDLRDIIRHLSKSPEANILQFQTQGKEMEKIKQIRELVKKWRELQKRLKAMTAPAKGCNDRQGELNNILTIAQCYIDILTTEPLGIIDIEKELETFATCEEDTEKMEANPEFAGGHDLAWASIKILDLKKKTENLLKIPDISEARQAELKNILSLLELREWQVKEQPETIRHDPEGARKIKIGLQEIEQRIEKLQQDPTSAGTHDDFKGI